MLSIQTRGDCKVFDAVAPGKGQRKSRARARKATYIGCGGRRGCPQARSLYVRLDFVCSMFERYETYRVIDWCFVIKLRSLVSLSSSTRVQSDNYYTLTSACLVSSAGTRAGFEAFSRGARSRTHIRFRRSFVRPLSLVVSTCTHLACSVSLRAKKDSFRVGRRPTTRDRKSPDGLSFFVWRTSTEPFQCPPRV